MNHVHSYFYDTDLTRDQLRQTVSYLYDQGPSGPLQALTGFNPRDPREAVIEPAVEALMQDQMGYCDHILFAAQSLGFVLPVQKQAA